MTADGAAAAASLNSPGALMSGSPPAPESQVTLANWQDPPFHRWAFRHLREIIPSQPVPAGNGRYRPLPAARIELGNPQVTLPDGTETSAEDVLAATFTDAFVVLHDGQLVTERYFDGMTASTRHLLMSVSKSIVGCVAGVLSGQGLLDPMAQVTEYVPEARGSGYGGASVRQLLDMRTGVDFRETYTAPDAEVRVMERSMGWRPALPGDPAGAYPYLLTLGTAGPHGGPFTYRSADTDMLGWVCERASGTRMADLIATLIWQPIGAEHDAEISCDPLGSAIHDGGISATARDLARFGQVLVDGGRSLTGEVVPEAWLADACTPAPGVREAFAGTDNEPILPGGWYRSQFWVIPGPGGPVLVCLGIHGQLVYADRAARAVLVKMSSWPDAQHPGYLIQTLRACAAIAASLSSGNRR